MTFHSIRTWFAAPFGERDKGLSLTGFLLFWQGILAGLVVAGLCYAALMVARLIFSGEEAGMLLLSPLSHFGIIGGGNVFWITLSSVVSIFIGGYIAGRLTGYSLGRAVWIQGLVLTGTFFFALSLPATDLRWPPPASTGFSAIVRGIFVFSDLSQWSDLQNPIARAFSREFRNADGNIFIYNGAVGGITFALIRGNEELAISTAVRGTGLPASQVKQRLDSVKAEFQQALRRTQAIAAKVRMQLGFTLLGTLLLGALLGILGGEWGRRVSVMSSRRVGKPEERARAAAA